jgi:hypothetical protein
MDTEKIELCVKTLVTIAIRKFYGVEYVQNQSWYAVAVGTKKLK